MTIITVLLILLIGAGFSDDTIPDSLMFYDYEAQAIDGLTISMKKYQGKKILIVKIILVSVLAITALVSLPFLTSPGHTNFKHALEWNYFIGVILFYLLSFLFWKKNPPQVHAPSSVDKDIYKG